MSSLYLNSNGSDGVFNVKTNSTIPVMDKAKEWQMELLMEKLRSKSGQYKTFTESAKTLRMALLEKRYPVDGLERSQLQKCLDTLQNSIRVTTLNGMVERLESVSRQLGLKFMAGTGGLELFISSDMFYVEVVLEPSGDVKDVKIHHEGKLEQQSCEELVNCLQRRDFLDFAAQLEGLASIYQLNAEKKVKCKALNALQSLETDLTSLATLQPMDAQSILYKSPVGILQKRRGGHAMRLTYWVSPYDLLDQKTMSVVPMTVEEVNKRNLGCSVTVCMEGSTAHKLQVLPLVTSQRSPNGNNVAVYSSLQPQNSATLPACFALRLKEPMPLAVALAQRIQRITDMECGDLSSPHPLLSLITQHASRGQLDCANNNGLFVTLPDQLHCYRMTDTKGLEGVMVSSVPFTHPKQVPHILLLLRQQAVFNSLISSCIRTNSRQDLDGTLLEITALSWQHVSVSLEHPQEESMATLEMDLTDPADVKCHLFGAGSSGGKCAVTPEFAAKVVQRCMSIPVTMRSLIKRWQSQSLRSNGLTNGNGNFNIHLGNGNGGGGGGQNDDSGRHGMPDMNGMRDPQIKMEPHDNGSNDMVDNTFPSFNSPLLGEMSNSSPLNPFGASTSMMGPSKETVVINLTSEAIKKKRRKRKVADNLWRSPKHIGDDCEILDVSSSNDSTPQGTPTSRDAPSDFRIPTPTPIEFPHLMEEGKSDPATAEKVHSEFEGLHADDMMEIQEMDSVEEMLKVVQARKAKKPREERKSPSSIMLDMEGKSMVPPSVSITPINSTTPSSLPSNLNSVLSGMGLERRPGIEIIPIGSTPPASLPSSITITPIPPSNVKAMSDDRSCDRKSRDKSRSEEEEKRLEKKRKRKREDSPMGPPDKLPPKQDPLSKPVSVSIKPTDSPPMSMSSRPSSPAGTLRKFSTSPTHTSPLALMSKSASSPGGVSKSSKPSTQQSPKHSAAFSTNSPKHNPIPSSASPKHHGTSSPKHTSGSSGKPSMSTLKSAASSPSSGKSSSSDSMKVKPPSSSKDSGSRDKDRNRMSSSTSGSSGGSSSSTCGSSSGHQSPKPKSSSIKVKQLDLSLGSDTTVTPIPPTPQNSGSSTPPSSSQETKSTSSSSSSILPQIRNRKNSLSAVIDKLKSAQHTTGEDIGGPGGVGGGSSGGGIEACSSGNIGNKDRLISTKCGEVKSSGGVGKPGDSGKNPGEYMVKPSSEGIKLTINKTRTKESSKSSSSNSSSSAASSTTSSSSSTTSTLSSSSSGAVKSSSSSSSQSGSGSPKIHSGHTGLKPGVNSGPASKKPQTSSSTSTSSSGTPKLPSGGSSSSSSGGGSSGSSSSNPSAGTNSSSNSSTTAAVTTSSPIISSSSSSGSKTSSNPSSSSSKIGSSTSSSAVPKSSSSSSSSGLSKSVSKSSGSPKLGSSSSSSSSDPNRNRDGKQRPPKSSSSGSSSGSSSSSSGGDKSLFSNSKGESRKSSPAPMREEETDRTFKVIPSKLDAHTPPFSLEGLVKSLDTKFQIPKLSARTSNPDSEQSKKTAPDKLETVGGGSRSVDSVKALDLGKPDIKYSITPPLPSSSASASGMLSSSTSISTLVSLSKQIDEKAGTNQSVESKMSKSSSTSLIPGHSSPSPRHTPSPLPKLESKTPSDGSPIPGLTFTPIGSIASLGGGGGSSSNDSLDLSIDMTSRSSGDSKSKLEPQRSSLSVLHSSASKEESCFSKPFNALSLTPGESPLSKIERAHDLSMSGEEAKKLSIESALSRMEEARSTPPSGPSSQEAAEMLLDFSSSSKSATTEPPLKKMTVTERVMASMPSRRNTPPPPMFPASPSVTMHIVKSPSPLIIPSPQSGSPCITDDDLMDEALVGMGKS